MGYIIRDQSEVQFYDAHNTYFGVFALICNGYQSHNLYYRIEFLIKSCLLLDYDEVHIHPISNKLCNIKMVNIRYLCIGVLYQIIKYHHDQDGKWNVEITHHFPKL